jgi:hypothetical protein
MKHTAVRHIQPGEAGITRGEMIENAITLAESLDWATHEQRGEFIADLAQLTEEDPAAVARARARLEARAKASRVPIPFAKPKTRGAS